MRKNIFRVLVIAAFAGSIIISCNKDNGSTPTTINPRDTFLGNWHVTSHHRPSNQTLHWDMYIATGSSTTDIYFDNFDQIGSTNAVTGITSGFSFTIPQQTVGTNTFKGSGTYYSNSNLSFTYTSYDGQQMDSVSATATK